METVALEKGFVHLMEDRIVVENDDATVRKRKNVVFYSIIVVMLVAYTYYSYQQYLENPHVYYIIKQFLFKFLLFLFIILPSIFNNVIRFSTTDEIPYSSITKHEMHGRLFNWNGGIKLYLQNKKIRTLWLDYEEMKKFRFLLDQKLMLYRPGL